MKKYYLAIDIGASSGRHVLASMENKRMITEEIYRFPNGMINKNGFFCWDIDNIFFHIKEGLKKCKDIGKIPYSVSVDTWGVDYVLLDKHDQMLGEAIAYRDQRTQKMDQLVREVISAEDLYHRTGIQKQIFNTIYQMMAVKTHTPKILDRAESLLMIPDYLHFLLTGIKKSEYTNATTSQLISLETNDWDYDLMDMLGYKKSLFRPVSIPGEIIGNFRHSLRDELGFDSQVVLAATHDTASAVLAIPSTNDSPLFISSGTWSLMGMERPAADRSLESMKANFTNEGGYDHRFRFLKNIMGLWMIQSVRNELAGDMPYSELSDMASQESISSLVNCDDSRFLSPSSMTHEVQDYCRSTGQRVPNTLPEIAAVIYNSLASTYKETSREIENVTGKRNSDIYIVGGGSQSDYLNALTAKATGKTVWAGPAEATAIGNILLQLISDQVFSSLDEGRACIKESFNVKKYE